jgi:hypothetical protein
MSEQAHTMIELVARIAPILEGYPPEIQSAVLADLTSMWLAGHQDLLDPESEQVQALRRQLFAQWCATVLDLVPVNAAMLRERWRIQ